ncbi:MAG: sugar-binding transcriptional regulator [Caldilineaceae bacterium]
MNEQHHEQLAQIASLYYEAEKTQDEIAQQLGLSRVKIYRLLKQAREEAVVQFTITWPLARDGELEAALKQNFGLREALVLKTQGNEQLHVLQRLGQLGARYLEQMLKDGMTLAVCLGRSTYEVIHAIRPGFQAKVHVAQAMGSLPFAMQELDSAALARQLAQKLGGEVLYLSSPLMADTAEAADILRNQRDIKRTLQTAQAADIALLGIGNLDPATSGFVKAGFISTDELTALVAAGAVGEMAGHFYQIDGGLHPGSYTERVIGVRLVDLKQIPTTMAVALGIEKAQALLGGLRTGVLNVLCTDDQAARAVLQLLD